MSCKSFACKYTHELRVDPDIGHEARHGTRMDEDLAATRPRDEIQ